MEDLKLYISSVSANNEIKGRQAQIMRVLEGKKIEFEVVDITACTSDKDCMREIAGDPKCLPPQLTRGNKYIGNYEDFMEAVEEGNMEDFLKHGSKKQNEQNQTKQCE